MPGYNPRPCHRNRRNRSAIVNLSALLIAALAVAAAERVVVHRCVGADGIPRYQDQPCEDGDDDQRLEMSNRRSTPPPVLPAASAARTPEPVEQAPPLPAPPELTSWRCDVENGEVYYRHDACPSFLIDPIGLRNRDGAAWGGMQHLRVWGTPVSRRQACNEINDGVRFGAERDQRASPYEKLSGRDLCR
jgi:hypothetical protein